MFWSIFEHFYVYGQNEPPIPDIAVTPEERSLESLIRDSLELAFGIVLILAIFFVIKAGISLIMAGGDETKAQEAREAIKHVVIGIVVAFISVIAVTFVYQFIGYSDPFDPNSSTYIGNYLNIDNTLETTTTTPTPQDSTTTPAPQGTSSDQPESTATPTSVITTITATPKEQPTTTASQPKPIEEDPQEEGSPLSMSVSICLGLLIILTILGFAGFLIRQRKQGAI